MRRFTGMNKTLRGRPRLNVDLEHIVQAVRQHGQVVGAARQLACSPAYVHARLKKASIPLAQVLQFGEKPGGGVNGKPGARQVFGTTSAL